MEEACLLPLPTRLRRLGIVDGPIPHGVTSTEACPCDEEGGPPPRDIAARTLEVAGRIPRGGEAGALQTRALRLG